MAETAATERREEQKGGGLPAQRRFSVDEYYRLAEIGVLRPDERVELIEGVIVTMSPIGSPHMVSVDGFTNWFAPRLDGGALLHVQSPIRLDDGSEPEPDLVLLQPPLRRYARRHPGPADVLLVIDHLDAPKRSARHRNRFPRSRAGLQRGSPGSECAGGGPNGAGGRDRSASLVDDLFADARGHVRARGGRRRRRCPHRRAPWARARW